MQSYVKDLKFLSSSISETVFIEVCHVHCYYMLEESHQGITPSQTPQSQNIDQSHCRLNVQEGTF